MFFVSARVARDIWPNRTGFVSSAKVITVLGGQKSGVKSAKLVVLKGSLFCRVSFFPVPKGPPFQKPPLLSYVAILKGGKFFSIFFCTHVNNARRLKKFHSTLGTKSRERREKGYIQKGRGLLTPKSI